MPSRGGAGQAGRHVGDSCEAEPTFTGRGESFLGQESDRMAPSEGGASAEQCEDLSIPEQEGASSELPGCGHTGWCLVLTPAL